MQQQYEEWRYGYMKIKCAVESCPQEALITPKRYKFRYERLIVPLCQYHGDTLQIAVNEREPRE